MHMRARASVGVGVHVGMLLRAVSYYRRSSSMTIRNEARLLDEEWGRTQWSSLGK